MKKHATSITSLPVSPEHDRQSRMLKYSIAMGIRLLCVISLIWVRGWWLIIPALGAVFLPYFAVVVANAVRGNLGPPVERPGAIVRAPHPGDEGHSDTGGGA